MDLTQAATPGYFATMALEHQVLKRRAERVGPSPADYERNDTLTSLGMGVLSLVAPFVAAEGAGAVRTRQGSVREGAGRHRGRRRPRSRRSPTASPRRTMPTTRALADARHAGAGSVGAPGRCAAVGAPWPSPRVASPSPPAGCRSPMSARSGPGASCAISAPARSPLVGRRPRVGLHLLLEPPVHAREPLHVGDPRRPSLERAVQPLDRVAPAGGRRARHVRRPTGRCASWASDPGSSSGARDQPALPVLDPHGHDPQARTVRDHLQHRVAPPRTPRIEPAIPRSQPRQHPDRVGQAVRHVRARGRHRGLRTHEEHPHLQPRVPSPRTSTPTCCGTSHGRRAGPSA